MLELKGEASHHDVHVRSIVDTVPANLIDIYITQASFTMCACVFVRDERD